MTCFFVSAILSAALHADILSPKTTSAVPPTVTSISPDNGPIAGGTVITIAGTGFKGEYERVESLFFDGASYIETDITNFNRAINTRFELNTSGTSPNMVYGSNETGATTNLAFGRVGTSYSFFRGSTSGTTNTSLITAGRNDITQTLTAATRVNGSNGPSPSGSFVTGGTIRIGGSAVNNGYFTGEFLSMTITGTTNHNLIPARKVSDPTNYGVVDLETGKFYGNSGSGTITGGPVINGAISPDAGVEVTINGRACTGISVVSNTELTCNTPSGLELGKEDVAVSVTKDNGSGTLVTENTTVTDGFEYALRLNSVVPKSGDPEVATEIEIDGGVFSTPPEQFESVEGIVFDGWSWIDTGINQSGTTKFTVNFRNPDEKPTVNTGLLGARQNNTVSVFAVWYHASNVLRSDYNSSASAGSLQWSDMLSSTSGKYSDYSYTLTKDDNKTTVIRDQDGNSMLSSSPSLSTFETNPLSMLLGSINHNGSYGTIATSAYSSMIGTIYSAQICKAKTWAEDNNVLYQEPEDSETCGEYGGTPRVLVRDFRPGQRTTDGAYGFYDMVSGAFFDNIGYGTFTPSGTTTVNELEVPLGLRVNFTYTDEFNQEQTGTCARPELVTPTKIKCTMPTSPLPGNGNGKVDLTVYANDVKATPGTADADDFYYGSPMVVESISPNRGSISGGQLVTITGNNFFPDDDDNDPATYYDPSTYDPITSYTDIETLIGNSSCTFRTDGNGNLLDPTDYTNTTITCITTANSGGISDIEVTSSYDYVDPIEGPTTVEKYYLYGGSIDPITGAITSGYLYEDDLISVNPTEGPTTGGTLVTIKGNNFMTDSITTRTFFGGAPATNVTVVDSYTITARTPAHAPGLVDILVVQDGYAASLSRELTNAFEYVVGESNIVLTPNRGYLSGGDIITITGTFDPNTTATVTFGGIASPSVTVLNNTQLEVITPPRVTTGRVDIVVEQWNTTIGTATGATGFLYIAPLTITSISPDHGPMSGGNTVTIEGVSFIPAGFTATTAFANLSVTIGGSPCTVSSVADYTDTAITCTTSAHSPDITDVTVSVGIGTNYNFTLPSSYTYLKTELSISSDSVSIISDTPGVISTSNTIVSVRTGNPSGYSISMESSSADLICAESGSTAKFTSILTSGTLAEATWGWAVGNNTPMIWQPVPTTTTPIVPISNTGQPSGPDQDGIAFDDYTVWFGTNANLAQPPCAYQSILTFTAVPLP